MFILASTDMSILTLQNIALLIIATATVIGSIVVIMNGLSTLKLRNKQFISSVVTEIMNSCSEETNAKINSATIKSQNLMNQKIDKLSGKLEQFIKSDEVYKKEKDRELREILTLLKEANIEVYKNDIRKIFYKLRETGEIKEYDKDYVDSIFPIYKALGGNSDVEAKYREICEFHRKLTRENFEKARANRKKKKKDKEEVKGEDANARTVD